MKTSRILSIVFTLLLVCVLIPVMAQSASAADYEELYVGTTKVDVSADASGEGWDWNASEKTLTLNYPSFSGTFSDADALIHATGFDLTVKGNAKLESDKAGAAIACDRYAGYGGVGGSIIIDGDITATGKYTGIKADRSLTISGGKVTAKGQYYGLTAGYSSSGGSLLISGGEVNATGGAYGMYADNITISGGTVEATATGSGDSTLDDSGIYAKGNITIQDSEVTATGGTHGINSGSGTITVENATVTATATGSPSSAIFAGKDIKLTDSTVKAESKDGGIISDESIAVKGGEVTATGGMDGISADVGITIDGGAVTVHGGIHGMESSGTITVKDGTVTVTAVNSNAIWSKGDMTFSGGTVTASAPSSGIHARGKLSIGSGITSVAATCKTGLTAMYGKTIELDITQLTIEKPAGGEIGTGLGELSGGQVIFESGGTTQAKDVLIVPKVKYTITTTNCKAYSDEACTTAITSAAEGTRVFLKLDATPSGKYSKGKITPSTVSISYLYAVPSFIMPGENVTINNEFLDQTPYTVDLKSGSFDGSALVSAMRMACQQGVTYSPDCTKSEYDIDIDRNGDFDIHFNQAYTREMTVLTTCNIETSFTITVAEAMYSPITFIFGVTKYPVWVGGVQVTEENKDDILKDGTASFDPGTNTLTLNGLNVGDGSHASGASIVSTGIDLTVKGSATLSGDGYGIYVLKTGESGGSLTLDGATITYSVASGSDTGIYADGSIGISGGKIDVTAAERGIRAGGSITISSGTVTATGGKYGICAIGNITISSGTVSGKATGTSAPCVGIYSSAIIEIGNGITKVTAESNKENTDALAFSAGVIKLGDELMIQEPEGGVLGTAHHIFESDGTTAAKKAVIVPKTVTPVTYTVTVNAATNGTISADKTSAAKEETVTLTITPATGYELDTLTVKDDGGNTVTVASGNTFKMPAANVTVTATFKAKTYTVTWVIDGTTETETYEYGATPSHTDPAKAADEQYTYTFKEWTPDIVPVTGDATYTAVFDKTVNKYTVTWVIDGTTETETYEYGATPSHTDPAKPADEQYTYTFKEWTPDIVPVTAAITYTAVFTETLNTYTVTWKNYDGTVLETDTGVPYGTTPTYDGTEPSRPADAEHTYTFAGWTPSVAAVKDNIEYTAVYTDETRQYVVTWVIDGTSEIEPYAYNETPSYKGATPTKAATAQYTYTFKEWTPAVETVTKDATYTAVFTETLNNYTVTWKNYDGTVLETDADVPYGTTPTYDGATPVKPADAEHTYTFKEWTPEIVPVSADATYTAEFATDTNDYTVTWIIDGRIETETYEYGETPVHAKPEKASDLLYYYTFKGWSPALKPVTEDAVYKAVFEKNLYPFSPFYPKPVVPVTPVTTEEPEAPALPFTDVSPDSPYYDDIKYVYDHDITIGMSDTIFGENLPLTRGMIVTVLWRMEGRPDVTYTGAFTDVPMGEWYTDGVEWAASKGIVLGYGDGRYGPDDNVTREQLAAILYRYANYKGYDVSVGEDTNILSYDDAFTWGDWAVSALQWACGTGVLEDSPVGMLRPTEPANRGEIAHAIHVFCEDVAK